MRIKKASSHNFVFEIQFKIWDLSLYFSTAHRLISTFKKTISVYFFTGKYLRAQAGFSIDTKLLRYICI